MGSSRDIAVCVIYAGPGFAWQKTVYLTPGAKVADALRASAFADSHPDYPKDSLRAGIFGQECALDHCLADGDRVEIYRPLTFDPMESRRRRAIHRKLKADGRRHDKHD